MYIQIEKKNELESFSYISYISTKKKITFLSYLKLMYK